jgi:hypothetical protein
LPQRDHVHSRQPLPSDQAKILDVEKNLRKGRPVTDDERVDALQKLAVSDLNPHRAELIAHRISRGLSVTDKVKKQLISDGMKNGHFFFKTKLNG